MTPSGEALRTRVETRRHDKEHTGLHVETRSRNAQTRDFRNRISGCGGKIEYQVCNGRTEPMACGTADRGKAYLSIRGLVGFMREDRKPHAANNRLYPVNDLEKLSRLGWPRRGREDEREVADCKTHTRTGVIR